MDRRTFLKSTGAGLLVTGSGLAWAQSALTPTSLPLLPITDITDGIENRITLTLDHSTHDFWNGIPSKTFGINRNYLGPIIKVKQGQTIPFDVINNIEDITTIHWHGLHIPGEVDGGPHQEIEHGRIWSPDVPIVQSASMNWFHSHAHGRTAVQVYKGLAGVILIEDDASLSADFPKTYGVDDFTLVLQDKRFNEAGEMDYVFSATNFEDGFIGEILTINGAIAPVEQDVPAGLVRLRILNACNASFLTLSMTNGPVNVIASDGGFLAKKVEAENIVMSPGERYEILVDMRQIASNSLVVTHTLPEKSGIMGVIGAFLGDAEQKLAVLTLNQTDQKGLDTALPDQLANLAPADASLAQNTRTFELQQATGADLDALAFASTYDGYCGDGSAMFINGKPMNMSRIDEELRKGEYEIWRINVDDMRHPFHIHGCSFRILSQSGAEPPAYAQGWKDMVSVEDGWSEVLVKFDHEASADAPYMYHCHILEHEDCGMMGQFTVS